MDGGVNTTYHFNEASKYAKQLTCDDDSWSTSMQGIIWRVNALLLISAILAGVIVGIGAYGQRYRHHPFTRFIFFGATTLFLPIISSIVSSSAGLNNLIGHDKDHNASMWFVSCHPNQHSVMVTIWALLVLIIMINTSIVRAVDDREGQNKCPPLELLPQGVWILYLGISYVIKYFTKPTRSVVHEVIPFVFISAKILVQCYAFQEARKSFALGRNPRLVFQYMQQLSHNKQNQHNEPTVGEDAPPPLLIMGEERGHMEKHPHGYVFKDEPGNMLHQKIGLVTIDRVWRLDSMHMVSTPQRLNDLCLSFALFKVLRCRFARFELRDIGSNKDTLKFVWSFMLKDGMFDTAFRVIADEISFVYDYYYSSLPIFFSRCWLSIVDIFISLLSIGYCILLAMWIRPQHLTKGTNYQFWCEVYCVSNHKLYKKKPKTLYGSLYFDLVPMFLLILLLMIVEMRNILSYACSNWTKVVLICRLLSSASLQGSLCMQKWFARLLRCRCNLMKHWDEKIGQCSLLDLRPRTTLLVCLRRLLHLPDQKMKVKVRSAVKASIIVALKSSTNGQLSNGKESLRCWSEVGETFLWACNSNSASNVILTWHIATSILEVRNQQQSSLISDHKIVATHISQYCAYLVTRYPELLPDDVAWSKSLYKATKKDVDHALTKPAAAGSSSIVEYEYHQLVEVLSSNSNHEVVQNGVKLAQQLVDTTRDEQTTWELLATFWSEMILYVAPSDNLKGHLEAIARGGELITLLWALLNHAGIVSRPTDATSSGTDDDRPSDFTSCPATTDDVV